MKTVDPAAIKQAAQQTQQNRPKNPDGSWKPYADYTKDEIKLRLLDADVDVLEEQVLLQRWEILNNTAIRTKRETAAKTIFPAFRDAAIQVQEHILVMLAGASEHVIAEPIFVTDDGRKVRCKFLVENPPKKA